jgi:uncharacterized protein YecE (DUF72 family)
MIRIGTSGWIYKHWRGAFYPTSLPQRLWLAFYAQRFNTVEINFTFYRLPDRSVFEQWRERVPIGFRFAVKGSKFLTHMRRLRDPAEPVARLSQRLEGLGDRAGPVLWQLRGDMARDDALLDEFLSVLPDRWQHTIEFRNASWLVDPVFDRLRRARAALCIPDHPQVPKAFELTADWTYLRFHHGGGDGRYGATQIAEWAARIDGWRRGGIDVWAYFNNDWCAYAVVNARELIDRLGLARPAPVGSPH